MFSDTGSDFEKSVHCMQNASGLTASEAKLFFLSKCFETTENRGHFIDVFFFPSHSQWSFILLEQCITLCIQKYASSNNIYLPANVAICLITCWKMLNKIDK